MPSGVVYQSFTDSCSLDSAGTVVFGATMSGTGITSSNNTGIFQGQRGSISPLLQSGSQAPGFGAGITATVTNSDYPVMNQAEVVCFVTTLQGTGITSSNNGATYSYSSGAFTLVAQSGNAAPDGGTYSTFYSPGNNLNPSGEVSFFCDVAGIPYPNDALYSGVPSNVHLVAETGMQVPSLASGTTYGAISQYGSVPGGGIGFSSYVTTNGVNSVGLFAGKPGPSPFLRRAAPRPRVSLD